MTLKQAEANYKRARTRHENEQTRGRTDLSVRQTRRMALAVASAMRARRKLDDAKRDAKRSEQHKGSEK